MGIDERTAPANVLHGVMADRKARTVLGIVGFVLATTVGAWVAIPLPLTPVPMTLQPLFVILAGALLGPWAGASAMAAYVALGAAGAPVFSGGHAGLPWLLGPTGGYLIAYPAAAFVVGLIAGTGVRGGSRGGLLAAWLRVLGGLVLGLGVIYLGGVSQLSILTARPLSDLLALGVLPFVGGDVVKVLIALVVVGLARFPGRDRSLGR